MAFLLVIFIYVIAHSTPAMAVRTELVFRGYPVKAFQTEIYITYIDNQYGKMYSCKNPRLMPTGWTFSVKRNILGLRVINSEGYA